MSWFSSLIRSNSSITTPSTSPPSTSDTTPTDSRSSTPLNETLDLKTTNSDKTTTTIINSNSTATTSSIEEDEDATAAAKLALSLLLEPFQTDELPILARTNPSIEQKPNPAMSIKNLYQYFPFFLSQTTVLSKALLFHTIYGPPKPSWGVELSLFTAFLRSASKFTHLSSLADLRSVLDLNSLLPTPKDGIVTPFSFKVKKRKLRGFLKNSDELEDGNRVLTGEWVITRKLWKSMQDKFGDSTRSRSGSNGSDNNRSASSRNRRRSSSGDRKEGKKNGESNGDPSSAEQSERIVLYLHGGAFYMMSAATHRILTISVSRYTESRVFAINYRLAPETRFPGQLHDAVSAYMRLIIDLKISPKNIIFAGDSAGGGLVLATLMYLRDEAYPLPCGAILMSAWVDLTMSCESWTTNEPFDYLPMPRTDDPLHPVKCLLGPLDIHKYLTHPYTSPLFGDFKGLPPLLIQAGEAEVLRDEITLLAHKAQLAGVKVHHEIFEDQVHVFQCLTFTDASKKAFQSQRKFVKFTLPEIERQRNEKVGTKEFLASTSEEIEGCLIIDEEIRGNAHNVNVDGRAEVESLPCSPTFKTLDLPSVDNLVENLSSKPSEEGEDLDLDYESDSETTTTQAPSISLASTSTSSTSIQTTPRRPLLRAYSSARDLVMSQSNRVQDISELIRHPTKALTQANSNKIKFTGIDLDSTPNKSLNSIHHSPSSSLHSRSSSHPDLRAVLLDYESSGPANTTKIFTPTKQ